MDLFMDILLPFLIGAIVPIGLVAYCFVSEKRKQVSFKSLMYGFGSFFAALGFLFLVFLFLTNVMSVTLSTADDSSLNTYLYAGGCVILLVFYLITEALRIIFYKVALKSESAEYGGALYGSGFVLAQNFLVLILCQLAELKGLAAVLFGVLMLISSVVYIMISILAYHMTREGQKIAGSALAFVYFLMYGIMLIVANVVVTYVMFALVVAFVMLLAYFTLPLPFKKEAKS